MPPELVRAVVLGVLQGLSEFLPISSSGHLVIVPELLNWPAPGLTFDATAHGGTALAVVLYFRSDWRALLVGAWRGDKESSRGADPAKTVSDRHVLGLLAIATVPAVAAGLLLQDYFAKLFSSPSLAAGMLLITAALLVLAERLSFGDEAYRSLTPGRSFSIGVAQALALIPGISRSGATISAGQMVGLGRVDATRFSFILAGPVTAAAALLRLAELVRVGPLESELAALGTVFVAAFVSGYWAIGWLLAFVRKSPLYLFALYTATFGLLSLWLLH